MKLTAAALVSVAAIAASAQAVDHKLELEFDELSAKASSIIEIVNAMEQRAHESGQSLRPDLVARRELVRSSIARAQEALQARNAAATRDLLSRARGNIERLNKML